jgi:hypothetical protein
MTLQEAYNKGLTDAETVTIEKLNNSLNRVDDGPFANPELEAVRQRFLACVSEKNVIDILEDMINGKDFEYDNEGTDNIIINFYGDLMKYLVSTVGERNKLGVRMKNSLSKVKYDLQFQRNVVN